MLNFGGLSHSHSPFFACVSCFVLFSQRHDQKQNIVHSKNVGVFVVLEFHRKNHTHHKGMPVNSQDSVLTMKSRGHFSP